MIDGAEIVETEEAEPEHSCPHCGEVATLREEMNRVNEKVWEITDDVDHIQEATTDLAIAEIKEGGESAEAGEEALAELLEV